MSKPCPYRECQHLARCADACTCVGRGLVEDSADSGEAELTEPPDHFLDRALRAEARVFHLEADYASLLHELGRLVEVASAEPQNDYDPAEARP